MYAFAFILAGILVAVYARTIEASGETICWWFGILLGVFLVSRTALHKIGVWRLSRRFDELYDAYNREFGDTSSGRQFLDDVKPWYEHVDSSLGLLSFFGDWQWAVAGRVAVALGEHFSGKTSEQRALENEIRRIAETVTRLEEKFPRSLCYTSIGIFAAGLTTQIGFFTSFLSELSQPATTASASTPAQMLSVDEAQKIAIQRYPALGVAGSKPNRDFVARYKLYRQTRPGYFRDSSWPINLAEEVSGMPHVP